MIDAINIGILVVSLLIVIAVFTSLFSSRFGAPLLLVFLGVGLLAGEDGLLGIQFDNAATAYFIGSIALALILFDSGFETKLASFKIAATPAITLATAGVLLTTGIMGAAVHYLFDLPWLLALLCGAIVSSTDAAAVFFLLRLGGIHLRDRMQSTIEVESGSNDPMAIFLTIMLVELIAAPAGEAHTAWSFVQILFQQIGFGIALGVGGGLVIVELVNRVKLDAALYPIVLLGSALALFGLVGTLGGSAFLAVYVAGLYAGNVPLRNAGSLRRFQRVTTWLAQIGMFLTLGLLATPSEFGVVLVPALVLTIILIFVARPVAVWACMWFFDFSRADITFMSWVGLRGAVSILLAIVPLLAGIEGAQMVFNATFIVVMASLAVQGWSIGPVARWLKVTVPPREGPVERIDLPLPVETDQEILVYKVHPQSRVAKGETIPRWAMPSLILRDRQLLQSHMAGNIKAGDHLYVVTAPGRAGLLDQLFAGPAADDHDRDLFGDFILSPEALLADVARLYGFPLKKGDEEMTVAGAIKREHHGLLERADRVAYGPVDLIVRQVDERHRITEVGLSLDADDLSPKPIVKDGLLDRLKANLTARRKRRGSEDK